MGGFGDSAGFWMVASGLVLGVAALLILSLQAASRGRIAPGPPVLAGDLQLYRDQLAGLERDLARGTIDPAEAARLKTEIARRLLEADRRAGKTARSVAPAGRGRLLLPVLVVLLALGGGIALYLRLGAPGMPDLPLAERIAAADSRIAGRLSQADFLATLPPDTRTPPAPDAEFEALMVKLRAAVDPAVSTDLTGLQLLARNETTLENYPAARAAQERLIAVKGAAVTAADPLFLAEILIREASGYVSPEAELRLRESLVLDPSNGLARYYSGLIFAQGGRFDRAFAVWEPLMEDSPPDAPWTGILLRQIGEIAALAGVIYTPPALADLPQNELPGPDRAAIEAAAEQSPAEQRAMAESMVAQLSERLAREGGSAAEWARLIRALAVLDRRDEAREILSEARGRFDAEADLAQIEDAARAAGLTEAP